MNDEILVIAELSGEKIIPATYETIDFALTFGKISSCTVRLIVLGKDVKTAALKLSQQSGLDVVALADDTLVSYNSAIWTAVLTSFIAKNKPRYVCIPHTSRGADFAPALAVRLGASCVTAAESVMRQNDKMCFARSIFNGKIRMTLAAKTDSAIITVVPGLGERTVKFPRYKPASFADGGAQKVSFPDVEEFLQVMQRPEKVRALGEIPAAAQDLDLTLAEVIVSAGRGIGTQENIELIRRLAGLFAKSALGCSRSLCDLGWLDYKHQIGLTGKTVAPRLYIACGISGAAQHAAGMRGSRLIAAINKDPQAAIFQIADIGIVDDLNVFVPLLLDKVVKADSL